MSVVLAGGVEVSRQCLEALGADGIPISLVIGYPPSLAGRAGYASMRESCERFDIPLLETADINDPAVAERIIDAGGRLLVVTGWSQLLKTPLLQLPEIGTVGMHPTRLPQGRGRAPIPWTLIKGLRSSAVTLFHLTEGVDDGDIIGQIEFDVDTEDDASTLYHKICSVYVELVRRYVPQLLEGTAPRLPQDHSLATTWPRRRPEDGLIDWNRSAVDLYNWVRGLTRPYPGAFTFRGDRRITVWKARPAGITAPKSAAPGRIISCGGHTVQVACADAEILELLEVCGENSDLPLSGAGLAALLGPGTILGGT